MSSTPSVSVQAPNATSVQVALRIRPTTSQDLTSIPARFQRTIIHPISATSVSVDATTSSANASGPAQAAATSATPAKKQVFAFDQVHPPDTTQYALFTTTAAPLISRFLEGFNCTILAYGQTSSGKTYSMTGVDLDGDPSDPSNGMGIIPRAVSTIFAKAKEMKNERGSAWQYSIKSSFVEIYNEDLIDLLGIDDSAGERREVQIREDKEGNILWSGLREINVRTANDVMTLLKQGSSIRRTNETDMNAQSSRSHAIFSLTLTQKRYTGSAPRTGRVSPVPPTPSRLARPGSMYARVGSPTLGRPPTPSFASAMGRAVSLRPGSSLGMRPGSPDEEDKTGEWVTVVSKFHFVDLAGSERLKRTAAVGERIKEGISINSGLLALGNVISALGDPSKSRTSTHVPYRDSKLTRLLQDSLGGNAHTLMVACVSPAEWNVGETVNTLKYANRARNIKNRAEIKEKEEGWEDLEWLQTMVTKLRKELKALKEGGHGGDNSTVGDHSFDESQSSISIANNPRTLQKYTELQSSYEALTAQFVERNDELTRLRRELEEKSDGSRTSGSAVKRYEEIVGPVIEEYEKTIAAMEVELKLSRTALEHTNDICNEQESEIVSLKERSAHVDAYVEELKLRFAKLAEKESATENYVKDLESKLKSLTDASMTSSESFSDLRKEVSRYKESEVTTAAYIASLEARLARSDADVASLREAIETLEAQAATRSEEVDNLQGRLEALLQERKDEDNWRESLIERERRVEELERRMEEWEKVRRDASEERERLGNAVGDVELAKRSLLMEVERREAETAAANAKSATGLTPPSTEDSTPFYTPRSELDASPLEPVTPEPSTPVAKSLLLTPTAVESETATALQEQFRSLQEEHTATLADLSAVTSKYRDALREISDLAAQISEAKLQLSTAAASDGSDVGSDAGPPRPKTPKTPTQARRRTLSRRESAGLVMLNGSTVAANGTTPNTSRRLFFRHAASAEGLHARSQSQSLSQELSSWPLSPRQSWTGGESLLVPPQLSIQVPPAADTSRSVESLEKEIMRLQEVLKEREAEISALEGSIQQSRASSASPVMVNGHVEALAEVVEEQEQDPAENRVKLSPTTINGFDELRKSMELEQRRASESSEASADDSLERLNELMRSMAQKESNHREVVESLNEQLEKIRRQHDELTALSRDQALNMSAELETVRAELRRAEDNHSEEVEALRSQLHESDAMHETLSTELEQLRQREAELLEARRVADVEHARQIAELQREHAEESKRREAEASTVVKAMQEKHESAISQARVDLAIAVKEATTALEKSHADGSVQALPAGVHTSKSVSPLVIPSDLPTPGPDVDALLAQTQAEHEEALQKLRSGHESVIQDKEAEFASTLTRLREEHEQLVVKVNANQEGALRQKEEEAASKIQRLQEEHAAALKREELARQGVMSESQSSQALAIQQLRGEHDRAISLKEAALKIDLESMKAKHDRLLDEKEDEHLTVISKLKFDHSAALSRLETDRDVKVKQLESALAKSQEDHQASVSKFSHDLEGSLSQVKEDHQKAVEDVVADHRQTLVKLRADHQEEINYVQATLLAAKDEHRAALAAARAEAAAILDEERMQQISTLAELDRLHTKETDTLRKARDLLAEEISGLRVTVEESDEIRKAQETQLSKQAELISSLERKDSIAQEERTLLATEVEQLKAELERTRTEHIKLIQEASNRDSLVQELDRHRSVLGEVQVNLQRTKDEMDNLQLEKMRQDALVRELQAQLAGPLSPKNSDEQLQSSTARAGVTSHRLNGIPPPKLPPLSPPPAVPPPPIPNHTSMTGTDTSISSRSNGLRTSSSSRGSRSESPQTSTPSTPILASPGTGSSMDSKLLSQIEEQNKHIEEQDAMIKTLNKQLTHCESDLQAHMDLVATLETSLTDSERNLRKARMQANEYAKERDALSAQTELLRSQLQEAQQEVTSARRSVAEEKQNYESRLDEERRAKERARAQLDSRMEEVARKKSKFACM